MSEAETEILKKKWRRNKILWTHGLVSAIILGVSHSIVPMFVSPDTFNLKDGFGKLITIVVASGLLGTCTYLLKSPLPALPKEMLDEKNDSDTI